MAVAGGAPGGAGWGAAGRGAGLRCGCGCGDGEGPNTRLTPQRRPSQPHNGARARAGLRYKASGGAGRGAWRRRAARPPPAPRSAPGSVARPRRVRGWGASRPRSRPARLALGTRLRAQPRPGAFAWWCLLRNLLSCPSTRRAVSVSHWFSGPSVQAILASDWFPKKKEVALSLQRLARTGFGGNVLFLDPVSSLVCQPREIWPGRSSWPARGRCFVAAGLGDFLRSAPNADSSESRAHRGCSQRERGRAPRTNRLVPWRLSQTWRSPKNTEPLP